MALPYYSKKRDDGLTSGDMGIWLYLPDLKKEIGHLSKNDLGQLPLRTFGSLVSSYEFAKNSLYCAGKGLYILRKTMEIYLELLKLGTNLGKFNLLTDVYLKVMEYLRDGQQETFHCNEQIKIVKDQDIEVRLKIILDKYHSLYEHNYKYSITLPVYCFDLIASHKDLNKKSIEDYCNDDVSYKVDKINSGLGYNLMNDAKLLLNGVDPHIRNAIGHKKVKFDLNHKVILSDRDGWQNEFNYGDLDALVESLHLNIYAHFSAMTLYIYNHKDELENDSRFSSRKYTDLKDLQHDIYEEIKKAYFIPIDIKFDEENSKIICNVKKEGGFDYPSSFMGNIDGKCFYEDIPPRKGDEQSLRVIYSIAPYDTIFKECEFNVYEWNDKLTGTVIVNLAEWNKIVKVRHTKEDLDKHIIKNTFVNKD